MSASIARTSRCRPDAGGSSGTATPAVVSIQPVVAGVTGIGAVWRRCAGAPSVGIMDATYDVVVLGTGSGGEVVANALAAAGRTVAAVNEGLFGGECPYLACVPSKALLLAAREHRTLGGDHATAWAAAVGRRDEAAEHRDDSDMVEGFTSGGIEVVRGRGRLDGRAGDDLVVAVTGPDGGQQRLRARAVVVGTGSQPVEPPVDGLADIPTWTSDQALSSDELPRRLAVLGGGAVGVELSQVYASFGVEVVLLEASPQLLSSTPPWAGELLADALRAAGADVRTGVRVSAARPDGDGLVLTVGDDEVRADRLLLAGGRRPSSADIGLETVGVKPEDQGAVGVDARCRVLDADGSPVAGLFAVGDVTGIAPYTHTATYQGRVVAAHLLGHGRDADYSGVPSAVYTDPAVFSVGETADAARERGADVASEGLDLSDTGRGFIEGRGGHVELVVDARDGRLLGATVVGPEADGWGGELALAVRARLDVRLLADHVHAFPTWGEAVQPLAERLRDRIEAPRG